MNRRTNRREGMSLLEVIIAMAVFLMSITGLVFLMGVASDSALEAQMRSQAMSICQSQLAKAASGSVPLSGQAMSTSEDDDAYQMSMDVDSGSFNGLHNVTAAYGIEGFTSEHLAMFEARGVSRVSIAYDLLPD